MADIGTTWPLRHMSGLIGGIWLSAIANTCYMLASRISSLVDIHSQYGLNSLLTSFRKYFYLTLNKVKLKYVLKSILVHFETIYLSSNKSLAQICIEIYVC